MLMNRVQFQKGLSLPEFLVQYGTEAQCEQAVLVARWPGGFVCPVCGVMQSRAPRSGAKGRLYWQSAGCQHQCSVTGGTVFEATSLPLTRWFLAVQLLTQAKNNVSALELTRQLGVSYRTAWLIKHKLLPAMVPAESERQLTGCVEVDDAYLGGERSGGKAGRGSDNKVPFVVAVQSTEDRRAHLARLSARPFTKEAMTEFIATSMGLPLTVVSDGLSCFTVAASIGAVHDREVTGGGKASVLNEKFRAVNTLIGNVMTALTGTYHAIKFAKYGYRYLAEVQSRFNRCYDMRAILGSSLQSRIASPKQPGAASGLLRFIASQDNT